MASALNTLSTKYIVSEDGEIYTRVLNEINKPEQINVVLAITKAIDIVSSNPKHYVIWGLFG